MYIACSGGVDSCALVELMLSFCNQLTLLHVNYQLRGSDSDKDENFVRELAREKGIEVQIRRVDLAQKLASGGNLQEEARKIRFDWFGKFLSGQEKAYLLLGHHADDQIETFYQRLARKSGVRGLSCMRMEQGAVIRPLLSYQRHEILHFARNKKLKWREDASNAESKYTRNALRNIYLPFLYEQIPDLKQQILYLIDCFQREQDLIQENVRELQIKLEEEEILDLKQAQKLDDASIWELFRYFGFQPAQLPEIRKLFTTQKGKKVISESHELIREKEGLRILSGNPHHLAPQLIIESCNQLPKLFDKRTIYLDAKKIEGELRLETWKIGDRIKPIGIHGSTLISDVLTDAQVPHAERSEQLVLRDDVNIHWCLFHKIGRMAIANEQTKQILRIRVDMKHTNR